MQSIVFSKIFFTYLNRVEHSDISYYHNPLEKQPPEVFYKKNCSEKFCNNHMKAPVVESLFNKFGGLQACNFFKKETPTQVFSREYCQNFNNLFIEHRWWLLLPLKISMIKLISMIKHICLTGS